MNDQTMQDEEIETLQSIYFPHELKASKGENGQWLVQANIEIDVPKNYKICYNAGTNKGEMTVNHLPPLLLRIYFVENYPSKKPPRSKIICRWLPDGAILHLSRRLNNVYRKNRGLAIVHTWIEYLKAKTLSYLKIATQLDVTDRPERFNKKLGSRTLKNQRKPREQSLIAVLEDYNKMKEQDVFLKDFHECLICFTEHMGSESMLFDPCKHIFCRTCLQNYFTCLINEGNCVSVKCPAYHCETEATQKQIRELLPPELFDKYDKLLLNLWFDTATNIIYCPRGVCQYPASREGEDSMAVCPSCQYAFCVYCKMGYHGIEACKINAEDRKKLVVSYQTATADEKRKLEVRYGKRQIENLVDNTMSEFWIEGNSKKCPKCRASIEKIDGCNKMVCFRCGSFFCWLCSRLLDRLHPYAHFQDPNSPCNNKLFEHGEADEDLDWDIEDFLLEDSGSEDIETDDPDSDDDQYVL